MGEGTEDGWGLWKGADTSAVGTAPPRPPVLVTQLCSEQPGRGFSSDLSSPWLWPTNLRSKPWGEQAGGLQAAPPKAGFGVSGFGLLCLSCVTLGNSPGLSELLSPHLTEGG